MQHHLSRLVRHHRTYSDVARFLGITPRYMRLIRNGKTSASCQRDICVAGKLLQLRELLRELMASGALSSAQIAEAWARIHQRGGDPPHAADLSQAGAALPRQ